MIIRLQQRSENRVVTLSKDVQQIFCETSTCKPLLQGKKWEPGFSFQEHMETTVLWKSRPLSSASMLHSLVQKHHGRASCLLWLHSHIHTWGVANSALRERHQMSTSSSLGSSVLVQMQKTSTVTRTRSSVSRVPLMNASPVLVN